LSNLSPCPLPLVREGGVDKRGAESPSKNSSLSSLKEKGSERTRVEVKPLSNLFHLSFEREK
jgi:hypothetical protein